MYYSFETNVSTYNDLISGSIKLKEFLFSFIELILINNNFHKNLYYIKSL